MKKASFGIVIRVRNLTSCKAFYRDILDLGDPVLDSSYRVVFIQGDFSLLLEKVPWETPLAPVSSRTAWFFRDGSAEAIRKKMNDYGYPAPLSPVNADKGGDVFRRFEDPEGNPFYVPAERSDPFERREKK